jgi:hypothetical protein
MMHKTIALVLLIVPLAAQAQQLTDQQIVDQFFPQWLSDDSVQDFNGGGPAPTRFSAFVAADLDGTGNANYLAAAYSNGTAGAVVIIQKQSGGPP